MSVELLSQGGTCFAPNFSFNITDMLISGRCVGFFAAKRKVSVIQILSLSHGLSIRLHRMTLLLGPPSSGKTTLLLTLYGKVDKTLHVHDHSKTLPLLPSTQVMQLFSTQ
jgi:hypothetical protein